MLVAKTTSNNLFSLTDKVSKDELYHLRETTDFYCPQCNDTLQLKIGRTKIPHFAHRRKVVCEEMFSESESAHHLQGKKQLFKFFSRFTNDVQLESVIPSLQQRPDILVSINGKRYAIEFQCSRIDAERFYARTKGYLSQHITPIWILKAPSTYLVNQTVQVKINEFQRLFIKKYNERLYLLMYDPTLQQFIYYNYLFPLFKSSYITYIQRIPQHYQAFPFFVPNFMDEAQFQLHLKVYSIYRHKFVSQRIKYSRKGVQDLFLRSLYELRLNSHNLPIFVGIPSKNAQAIAVFTVEWQVLLFYFLHLQQLSLERVDKHTIRYYLIWSKLPLTEASFIAVSHYVELLQTLNVKHLYSIVDKDLLFELLYREVVAIS